MQELIRCSDRGGEEESEGICGDSIGKTRGFYRDGGTIIGGSILIYEGTNNAEREDTTVIVRKYRDI